MTLKAEVTEVERQELRRLCGSLQYAAAHTRPDLCAKTGQLQSMVTRAKVKHLLEAKSGSVRRKEASSVPDDCPYT